MTAAVPLTATTPSPDPSCLDDPACNFLYEITESPWLAEGSFYALIKPTRIILILAMAVVVRYLLNRTIRRLVRTTSETAIPTVLKPLRERTPITTEEATKVYRERRRQRAEAIGSVLRSFVTAFVYSIAALMVLRELGFDLAPLLASAGIAGVALGFGAQTLVKDLIAGLFMLLEDQYGVGDIVDIGDTTGVVVAVGLRITTVRDEAGVLWYIRNGEISRVGNKSQGWTSVVVDLPVSSARRDEATTVLRAAADRVANVPELAKDILEPPKVHGVETATTGETVIRTVVKTTAMGREAINDELRRQLTEALEHAGLAAPAAAPGTPPSQRTSEPSP
ncbi:MAG: mechanosensitive ion channel protein MscS [Actinobacteria bacterium]|nr:MAG: mechanosensitive ion channel protein MscS [Actinomycetota bacterium]